MPRHGLASQKEHSSDKRICNNSIPHTTINNPSTVKIKNQHYDRGAVGGHNFLGTTIENSNANLGSAEAAKQITASHFSEYTESTQSYRQQDQHTRLSESIETHVGATVQYEALTSLKSTIGSQTGYSESTRSPTSETRGFGKSTATPPNMIEQSQDPPLPIRYHGDKAATVFHRTWFTPGRIFLVQQKEPESDRTINRKAMVVIATSYHDAAICLSLCVHSDLNGKEEALYKTHMHVTKNSEALLHDPRVYGSSRTENDPMIEMVRPSFKFPDIKIKVYDNDNMSLHPHSFLSLEHTYTILHNVVPIIPVGDIDGDGENIVVEEHLKVYEAAVKRKCL